MASVRVLLIAPRSSGLGGIAHHVSALARKLRERGVEVHMVSCENTPHVPLRGLMNPSFAIAASAKCLLSLPYPPRPYDVVHAHSVPSALAMRASWARLRVLTLHGAYGEQVEALHQWAPPKLVEWAEGVALSWAHVVTAVSRSAVEHYARRGFRAVYVPNAVDLAEMPREGIRLYERQAVYVGRLSWEKGVDVLVEAFKRLPHLHLIVVGGGPEEARLRSMARGHGNIHFVGPLPRRLALRLIRGSDVLIQPSRREGLSTSMLEAMSMGVPVVATSVGGNVELVEDGRTGVLVEPEDPEAIASAVESIVEDRELAKRLSVGAARLVAERYSWDVAVDMYLEVYRRGLRCLG